MADGCTVLALDAMGVVYRHGDDVADLLVPYLRSLGCTLPAAAIEGVYRDASLGLMPSRELWARCGVPGDDAAYCGRHELMPGIVDALRRARRSGLRIACLSNDVSEWSRLLRRRFGLDAWVDTWVVSGDIGVRKPDPAAYARLVDAVGVGPGAVRFVDDRPANVAAAADAGLRAELFVSAAALAA